MIKNFKSIVIILFLTFVYSACADGYFMDDCGNCWAPYCHDSISDENKFDVKEQECNDKGFEWVIPNSDKHIYYNKYCDGNCPDNFMIDECGKCWSGFCYSFFSKGLNDDPAHSVYYDLNEEECQSYGFNYYLPNTRFNPYWNSQCEIKTEDKKNNKFGILLPIILILAALSL